MSTAATALAGGVYGLALIFVSLASHAVVLAPGQEKQSCGWYLDCHRNASLVDVNQIDTLGDVHAHGSFYVITVRFGNSARRAALRFRPLAVEVRDAMGRRYERDAAGERVLAAHGLATGVPADPLPAGTSVERRFVFDLPRGVRRPHLSITDADPLARATELFLIGDEDSFLHASTTFALDEPSRGASVAQTPKPVCTALGRCPADVRLANVSIDTSAGVGAHAVPADGMFWVVTLRVRPGRDAEAPHLDATVVDATGRRYQRARDVEALLPATPPSTVRYVFDLPGDIPAPRLVLREPGLLNALFGRPARLVLPSAHDRA